jgi:predicted porin
LDASVAYVKNPTDNTGKSATYLNDSAISTSRWGMRGTEDLGGGLKANFNLESDVNMGTGANNPAGMFRRSAYVSLASDQYGELRLGRATSVAVAHLVSGGIVLPSNAMHGTMLIGAGLTGTAADFFTKNAITYYSPVMSGVRATLQYSPPEFDTKCCKWLI